MKTKMTVKSAVAVTLLGLSHAALADTGSNFTPVENLMPEQRQEVFEKLSQMTGGADLNWDQVAVGVNENGDVVVVDKKAANLQVAPQPSSMSGG
jgi:hypothetical protein